LPDIGCDSHLRAQNGVVVNYLEAKQTFLSVLGEEGVPAVEFDNFDQAFSELLEDQLFQRGQMEQFHEERKLRKGPT